MRHLKRKKLGRETSQRFALLRSLATGLFEHGEINTTLGKAKALRPYAEKLITVVKTNDNVNSVRKLKAVLYTDKAIKMCVQYAKLFSERKGGYVRVLKNGFRYGDAAPMGHISFVEKIEQN